MKKNVFSIIAHFDPTGQKSANWQNLLQCLSAVSTSAVVVSTGITKNDINLAHSFGFNVIVRDNIGYDFMSYAVGIAAAKSHIFCENFLICNDSIFIFENSVFLKTLKNVLALNSDVNFMTSCKHFYHHGQSYLFYVKGDTFRKYSFQNFFNMISLETQKMNIILKYEVGFSVFLDQSNISWNAELRANFLSDNITHWGASKILQQYGFAKIERISLNPLKIKNDEILNLCIDKFHEQKNKKEISMSIPDSGIKALVICHCHYLDMVDEIIDILDRLPNNCQIYITSSNCKVLEDFRTKWRRKKIKLSILLFENKGRDVLPFLETLKLISLPPNTPILKIHGKKSLYSPQGNKWRQDLINQLIPSEKGVCDILEIFNKNSDVGMIGPYKSYITHASYWGSNLKNVEIIFNKMNLPINTEDLGFFAGTMFWIRAQSINEIIQYIITSSFQEENGQRDGTFAHAVERAIPMLLYRTGWKLLETPSYREVSPRNFNERRIGYYEN